VTVRVALVGLPGVGKSTIGAALAKALGATFVDVDDLVAAAEGASPASLLRSVGEGAFRVAEARALSAALAVPGDVVVATGGGAVESADSRAQLAGFGTVVHLVAPAATLLARLDGGDRPLVAEPSIERLEALEARRGPWYDEVSDVTIEATGDVDEVVERLCDKVAAT